MSHKDLTRLLEEILREHHQDCGISVQKIEKFKNVKPAHSPMSAPSIAIVHGSTGAGEPFRCSLFLKNAPDVTVLGMNFLVIQAFKKEAYAYSKIFPQIPEVRQFIPEVYFCAEDLIVMENLSEAGFKMQDKMKGLDFAQAELVMKAIGTIHAGTFNLRLSQGESQFDKQFSNENPTEILENNPFLPKVLEKQLQSGIDHLIYSQDSTLTEAIAKIEAFKERGDLFKTFLDLTKSDITVVRHGDLCIDNIMFRSGNDPADAVKFVDFQGIRLGSPAADIWTFLYSSVSVQDLDLHCDELLSIYCCSFIRTLERCKTDRSLIPAADALMNDITSRELYGLVVTLTYVAFMFTDRTGMQDLYKKLNNVHEVREKTERNEINRVFANRIAQVARRLISRNVI